MRSAAIASSAVALCVVVIVWQSGWTPDVSQPTDSAPVAMDKLPPAMQFPSSVDAINSPASYPAASQPTPRRTQPMLRSSIPLLPPSKWCEEIPTPSVPFKQVESYIGHVAIGAIARQLANLADADPRIPGVADMQIVFFALDGTLLNLLRWGRIVNDNDIDLGFYLIRVNDLHTTIEGPMSPLPINASNPLFQYRMLQRWLFARGLIQRELMPRDEAKMHHARKLLKPQSCKHRGQMMQCRLDDTPVIVDWFGIETLHSAVSGLVTSDVLPVARCKAFAGTFPCPRRAVHTLRTFSLNVGSSLKPQAYFEFGGCALFPRRNVERDRAHVESILQSATMLQDCKYPSLIDQLNPQSPLYQDSCTAVVKASGAHT